MTLEERAKEIILEILEKHRGHQCRISRVELLFRINHNFVGPDAVYISDRAMRNLIEELRTTTTKGAWICSSQKQPGGYYLATSLQELEDYLAVEDRRGVTILTWTKSQRQHARERLPGIQEKLI